MIVRFIRLVVARRHPDSEVEDGAFTLAYELRRSVHVDAVDQDLLAVRTQQGRFNEVRREGSRLRTIARSRACYQTVDSTSAEVSHGKRGPSS